MRFIEFTPNGIKQPVFINAEQIASIGPVPGDPDGDHCRIHLTDGQVVPVPMPASEVLSRIHAGR